MVWRCTRDHAPSLYLKAADVSMDMQLGGEAERLRWMRDQHLPVPIVREYGRAGDVEFLILEEVRGVVASDLQWAMSLPAVITALGEGLAFLHRTPIQHCPFDHRIATQIHAVRGRIAAGRVREDGFDEIRAGRTASDLFTELLRLVPANEDLVFAHGDFCLPNILLARTPRGVVELAGLIDCGRAGVADRHQDIALGLRSITDAFGPEWIQPFLRAYGLPHADEERVLFFTLLDEFF